MKDNPWVQSQVQDIVVIFDKHAIDYCNDVCYPQKNNSCTERCGPCKADKHEPCPHCLEVGQASVYRYRIEEELGFLPTSMQWREAKGK